MASAWGAEMMLFGSLVVIEAAAVRPMPRAASRCMSSGWARLVTSRVRRSPGGWMEMPRWRRRPMSPSRSRISATSSSACGAGRLMLTVLGIDLPLTCFPALPWALFLQCSIWLERCSPGFRVPGGSCPSPPENVPQAGQALQVNGDIRERFSRCGAKSFRVVPLHRFTRTPFRFFQCHTTPSVSPSLPGNHADRYQSRISRKLIR